MPNKPPLCRVYRRLKLYNILLTSYYCCKGRALAMLIAFQLTHIYIYMYVYTILYSNNYSIERCTPHQNHHHHHHHQQLLLLLLRRRFDHLLCFWLIKKKWKRSQASKSVADKNKGTCTTKFRVQSMKSKRIHLSNNKTIRIYARAIAMQLNYELVSMFEITIFNFSIK